MKNITLVSMPLIIGLVAGGVAVLVGVGILLYFTVFAHSRLKKEVGEISKTYSYYHSLLNAQDAQYLKRIEFIAMSNLIYVEINQSLLKRYKEIRDKFDASTSSAVFNLKDYLDERNYKDLKAALPDARSRLEVFEEEAKKLHQDLLDILNPEEECKAQATALKEKLRGIKQDYYSKEVDLHLLNESFERVFDLIDKNFAKFDEFISDARYEEAKDILPKIENVLNSLTKALIVLPNLCVSVEKIIPEKISYINDMYQTLNKDGYPLNHLHFNQTMMEIDAAMEKIVKRLKNFEFENIQMELDEIILRIDEFETNFKKEKEARSIFENECDNIYAQNANIEKKYIKLCNSLPDVKRIYVLQVDEQTKIDSIKVLINKAGATKRSLDTFIHSGSKQPYTTLVEKMHTLEDESSQASVAIDEFDEYLHSLKTDCEDALKKVKAFYTGLKESEDYLHKINLPVIYNKYNERVDKLYKNIGDTYSLLHNIPIDVKAVNVLSAELEKEGSELLGQIKNDYGKMLLCESSIVYGNRFRYGAPELNSYLVNSEALYFAGDFDKCYDDTVANIKRINGLE